MQMKFSNYNNGNSPVLQACIMEYILTSCINGATITELIQYVQTKLPSSRDIIKKYLFYLIEFELVSYHGPNQKYMIEADGLELLSLIHREKRMNSLDEETVITLE